MSETIYCRLCAELKLGTEVISLNKNDMPNVDLNIKIYQCFRIQIEPDDILPNTICLSCCEIANNTYEIHLKFQQAQEFLKNVFVLLAVADNGAPGQNIKQEHKDIVPSDALQVKLEAAVSDDDNADFSNFPDNFGKLFTLLGCIGPHSTIFLAIFWSQIVRPKIFMN